jgi:hypothetical protein
MSTTKSIVESFDSPHSCQHCQKYPITWESKSQQNNKNRFELSRLLVRYTYAESISGARGGCPFFQYCFSNWDNPSPTWLRTKARKRKSLLVILKKNGVAEVKKEGKTSRKMMYRMEGHLDFRTIYGTRHRITSENGPINKHPGLETTFELVRRRKNSCNTSHDDRNCRPLVNATLPTRVIDVRSGEEHPQLHLTSESERADYACLSYCWGGDQATKLTKDTLKAWTTKPGIPFHELPQSRKDAIITTSKIGIRYP